MFTQYGYTLFTEAWIGDPPVKFGAPRTSYNTDKMREFVDYMASGRQTDPVTNARVQYVLDHDEAKQFGNQLADNRQFIITRDYDSVLAVSERFPIKETAVEIYTISDFKKGLQGTTHMNLRFAVCSLQYSVSYYLTNHGLVRLMVEPVLPKILQTTLRASLAPSGPHPAMTFTSASPASRQLKWTKKSSRAQFTVPCDRHIGRSIPTIFTNMLPPSTRKWLALLITVPR
jgi:hypothetical protein